MLIIVVEEKNKRARRIDVGEILKKTVNREWKKIFSKEIAETVTYEIMEAVEYPTYYKCILKGDNKLYSLDLNSIDINEICLEEILPTQTTDFGEDSFAVAIEELKKCVLDFTYCTDISKVIENPYIMGSSYGKMELYSMKNINSQELSSILQEYFSEESEKELMKDLEGYLNAENFIAKLNCEKGIYYLATHENNKPALERPKHIINKEILVNIIKPHLKGYVKFLNEICMRVYNYGCYGVTKKSDVMILDVTSKYLLGEVKFEGMKLSAIQFLEKKNENCWYIAKPFCMTVSEVFKLLKENSNYRARVDYCVVEEIKRIMGEFKEDEEFTTHKQRYWTNFSYRVEKGNESYFMNVESTGEQIDVCQTRRDEDVWSDFEKRYQKRFKEPLDKKEFYVYFSIKE